jgi:L-2,4-diaminobutyrate decarboxylase
LQALFAAIGGYSDSHAGSRANNHIFCAKEAHSSISKAARVLGLGESNIVAVESDIAGRMIAGSLSSELRRVSKEHTNANKIIVATVGSTIVGACDDVAAISKIAEANNCWLHVDAVYGAALMYSNTSRFLNLAGTTVHSISLGPQKVCPRFASSVVELGC